MLTPALARRLRDESGLLWSPVAGDRFVIDAELLADQVFWISDLTVEPQSFGGVTVLGFNGTTEWALDSVALEDALWLPREDQLRELLRATFRSLTRLEDAYRVDAVIQGEPLSFEHPEPADAYALALLALVRRSA